MSVVRPEAVSVVPAVAGRVETEKATVVTWSPRWRGALPGDTSYLPSYLESEDGRVCGRDGVWRGHSTRTDIPHLHYHHKVSLNREIESRKRAALQCIDKLGVNCL